MKKLFGLVTLISAIFGAALLADDLPGNGTPCRVTYPIDWTPNGTCFDVRPVIIYVNGVGYPGSICDSIPSSYRFTDPTNMPGLWEPGDKINILDPPRHDMECGNISVGVVDSNGNMCEKSSYLLCPDKVTNPTP